MCGRMKKYTIKNNGIDFWDRQENERYQYACASCGRYINTAGTYQLKTGFYKSMLTSSIGYTRFEL